MENSEVVDGDNVNIYAAIFLQFGFAPLTHLNLVWADH